MPSKSTDFDSVVVDLGGVVVVPVAHVLEDLAAWHRVTVEALSTVLMGPRDWSTSDHPWHRAERGELTVAAMQAEVVPFAQAAGIELRGDEYEWLLAADIVVDPNVITRVEQLKAQGYSIGLVANGFRELKPAIDARVDFSLFDVVVDSFDVGHRTPDAAVYEIMANRLGVDPARIVYLDDTIANLDGARDAGWSTIHVGDVQDALFELEQVLSPDDQSGAGEDGGRLGNDLLGGGTWSENGGDTGGAQLLEVVVGDYPADDDSYVAAPISYYLDDQGGGREVGA